MASDLDQWDQARRNLSASVPDPSPKQDPSDHTEHSLEKEMELELHEWRESSPIIGAQDTQGCCCFTWCDEDSKGSYTSLGGSTSSYGSHVMYLAVSLATLSGLLFGYDVGATSAVLSKESGTLTDYFNLSQSERALGSSGSLIGTVIGSGVVWLLGDSLGRRKELILSSVLYVIGSGLSMSAWGDEGFGLIVLGRAVYGLGVAFAMHAGPVLIAEVSTPGERGRLVALKEVGIVLGMLVGLLVAYGALDGSGGWRLTLGLPALPATLLLIGYAYIPASPRWLRLQSYIRPGSGYTRELALEALACYRCCNQAQLQAEMQDIEKALLPMFTSSTVGDGLLSPAHRIARDHGFIHNLKAMAAHRRAVLAGFGLVFLQQLSGQPAVLYYSTSILSEAGFGSSNAILAAALVAAIKLLATAIAAVNIDKFGRRHLLMLGISTMAVSLFLLGMGFQLSPPTEVNGREDELGRDQFKFKNGTLVLISLLGFVTGYQIGFGPVSWVVVSEVFPLHVRGTALGAAVLLNFSTNLAMTLTFLPLLDATSPQASFWIYAAVCILSLIFVRETLPETAGMSLEQIEDIVASEND